MENLNLIGAVYDCEATDDVVASIQGAAEDYSLDINSPGGDVFAGLTIVNAIQNSGHKATANVHVMAASIAAIIALACDEVVVDENSVVMLHNCWTVADGNKEELQNAVEAMKRIDAIQRNILAAHCRDIDKVSAAMDAGDFWMTADEAAEYFDNVVVKKVERPEGSLAAVGSLYDLVIKSRAKADDDENKDDEPEGGSDDEPAEPDEGEPENPEQDDSEDDEKKPNPDSGEDDKKPQAYVVAPALVALFASVDKELEG
ncbi:MAG: ATP-dependent Clp protease proteolytic subunit [Acidaminococcus provencensis]|jgi:ATP-dependent protease ClpP protease subunit|uniref:ATP-dependent Clp protease proteolytic subunit n=1 Tax=Acidaminococcus provencensis TaxID=2058289 RepID=UPI0023F56361|nr:ATP-dependent Clp protease proteolytic subunit [Acidaminococcus provencensis]MCH4096002.1 ATP-dependent Clp protease proteolytic subunit [Acidaminococcus provencensis]